ncbi:hypothetical protein THAOC_28775 [Thalassiosira oceanica]|uniref:Uncharacterized protein n=1 Tax=Thalassiosira oceanica TaxID=159749 RepID=K0RFG5_THAOC|nr:hypothetical protein THAOC_28775 [Thalassiosira oceanica]|eukprot:EJK52000.1 hypothetical protein THAOC_28775 [Thalassiosira oceanica]
MESCAPSQARAAALLLSSPDAMTPRRGADAESLDRKTAQCSAAPTATAHLGDAINANKEAHWAWRSRLTLRTSHLFDSGRNNHLLLIRLILAISKKSKKLYFIVEEH